MDSSSPGTKALSLPPTIPPVSKMQVTLQTFVNQFQEEVTQMVESGLTDPQIRQKIEETHSLTQAESLEETITTYFNRGLTIQQIHHALTTSHNYTQSLQSVERKINTMNLSRHTDDLDSQKVDIETVVSFMIEIHQTPKGCNVGYRKMKQLLQTKFGILVHKCWTLLVWIIGQSGYSLEEYSRRLGPILYGLLMGMTNSKDLGLC
ncbi:hypothetical protein VP01_1134g4, partial [Puccinia sorghi]